MKKKIAAVIFIALIALIGFLLAFHRAPEGAAQPILNILQNKIFETPAPKSDPSLFVTLKDGEVAVYSNRSKENLLYTFQINLRSLPQKEQLSLLEGFTVASLTELNYLMEDYTL